MKFFTSIFLSLIVVVTSMVSAAVIDLGLPRGLHEKGIKVANYPKEGEQVPYFKQKQSEACANDVDKSELGEQKCIDNFTLENHREVCETVLSDECQKYYEKFKDPLAELPNCVNDTEYITYLSLISTNYVFHKYYCTLNGDGNICPLVSLSIGNGTIEKEDYLDDCPYKSCVDNRIDYLEYTKKYGYLLLKLVNGEGYPHTEKDHVDFMEHLIEQLKSPECTAQMKDDTATAKLLKSTTQTKNDTATPDLKKSAAKSLNAFNSLLSLLLLFFYLLF